MHTGPTGLETVSSLGEFAAQRRKQLKGRSRYIFPKANVLTPEALRKLARTRSLKQWIEYNAEGAPHADHA